MSKYKYSNKSKDLNYSTCFDVYGEEYYIYETKLNKFDDINIELYYGCPVEPKKGPKNKLILTKDLKELIENNEKRHAKQFGEFLPKHIVTILRRKFKENPYKSYVAWRDSKDKDKPKEIRILNTQANPEILTDYLGEKHVLSSAIMSVNGMPIPMGIPKDVYAVKGSQFKIKKHIITKEIVEYMKLNYESPSSAAKETSLSFDIFTKLREELFLGKRIVDASIIRLAVHLVKIHEISVTMFVQNHTKDTKITFSALRGFNSGLSGLKKYNQSTDKEKKEILKIIYSLEEVPSAKVNKQLRETVSQSQANNITKVYKVLMIARDYNYDMPDELRKLLKYPYSPNYVKPKKPKKE